MHSVNILLFPNQHAALSSASNSVGMNENEITNSSYSINLTPLARLAGIPYPTIVSPALASQYGLSPTNPLSNRADLYDLVWAVRVFLGYCPAIGDSNGEPLHQRQIEFWSYLPAGVDPVLVQVIATLNKPGTEHACLQLSLPNEPAGKLWPRILVVEDDFHISRALDSLLSRRSFEVTIAASGAAAMRIATEQQPHLVLLDVDLPDAHGFLVCKQIHSNPETKHIPIIMTSAWLGVGSLAKDAGAVACLEKPTDFGDLPKQLRSFLSFSPTAKTAEPPNERNDK